MTAIASPAPTYLLGHSEAETRRLVQQARFLNPATRRCFAAAGIGDGMRVLDAGSGAGDVALVAAELVGPRGAVVGVDQDPGVLAVARARAEAAGLSNVTFLQDDLCAVTPPGAFDAVVGRLVLAHNPDPLAVLRALVRHLRPGGIVVFQEANFTPASVPPTPLWTQVRGWMRATAERLGVHVEIGWELHRLFRAAGLPPPWLTLEALLLCGPEREAYEWAAATLRSKLPLALKLGIVTADEVAIDSLAERLQAETVAADAVVKLPDLVSAWTRYAPGGQEPQS
jgi:SAM-dependent methyltransferase